MSKRPIRVFEYVNQPYERVAAWVKRDPEALFRRATDVAGERARTVASGLDVDVGGLAVRAPIEIEIASVEEHAPRPGAASRVTRVSLRWQAAKGAAWFPTMEADLSFYPLSPDETQVDLDGSYVPPLGAVGAAANALVGHRIAEASVHRFVRELTERVRADLGA
jgi:hypothetical protein